MAGYERQNPAFRYTYKAVITPLFSTCSMLSYLDIDAWPIVYGIAAITTSGVIYVSPTVIAIKRQTQTDLPHLEDKICKTRLE